MLRRSYCILARVYFVVFGAAHKIELFLYIHNMWSLPLDAWKEILVHPQQARAMSFTCHAAAAALRGIFVMKYKDSGSQSYAITGRHYSNTIILDEDSIKTLSAEWYSIGAFHIPQLHVQNTQTGYYPPARINGNNIIVLIDDDIMFVSTVDQLGGIAAAIGIRLIGISAIYSVVSIHENFRGVSLSRLGAGNTHERGPLYHVVINHDHPEVIRTTLGPTSILGTVVELELLYDDNHFISD